MAVLFEDVAKARWCARTICAWSLTVSVNLSHSLFRTVASVSTAAVACALALSWLKPESEGVRHCGDCASWPSVPRVQMRELVTPR